MRWVIGFVRWQVFLWRYREHMYLAVMKDDARARQLVDYEAARRQLPPLPVNDAPPSTAVVRPRSHTRRRFHARRGFLPGA
jgi:hypothetical protein